MTPDQLLSFIDEGLAMSKRVPPTGSTFAVSVSEKLTSIRKTVDRTQRVSDRQERAVTNMISGLQKWLEPPTQH